ncbi:MAG: hypothetical protein ABIH34_02860 [Nanoarchaeota archaeon]
MSKTIMLRCPYYHNGGRYQDSGLCGLAAEVVGCRSQPDQCPLPQVYGGRGAREFFYALLRQDGVPNEVILLSPDARTALDEVTSRLIQGMQEHTEPVLQQ